MKTSGQNLQNVCIVAYLINVIQVNGIPTVTLNASSSPYFDIGGSMTLTCSINEDVPIISAYLIKGAIVYLWIQPINSSGCDFILLTSSDPHVYSGSCEQNMKTIHITINRADVSDHSVAWRCSMSCQSCGCSGGACVSTSNVTTALRVPVSSVQLTNGTGQPLLTPVPVLEGSNKDFRCDTSPNGSRPRALFKWYKRSENQSPILIQDKSISTPGPSPELDLSISISYSTLTLMGSRSYHNMYIYCEAQDETNRGNVTRSREVQLNIVYPPVVQLFPTTFSLNVIEGSKFEFRCNVTDANPLPLQDGYSWLFGGHILLGQARSFLELLNVQKSQDGVYQCMAKNEYGIGNSSRIYLNVLYSPIVENFTSPVKVIQGQPLEVVCTSDGNPPAQMSWNPAGEDKMNTSRLYYSAISMDKAVVHTCTATNNMVPTTGGPQTGIGYKELIIDVLYPPAVKSFAFPEEIIEGKPLEVVCTADGNPSPQVSWNPAGEDRVNKSRLYYSAISMDKAVVHTCTATNNMVPTNGGPQTGKGYKELLIDILYNASVYAFTSKDNISVLNENDSLQLQCLVDSKPKSVISLHLENELKMEVENAQSLTYIKRAACLDAGKYTCSARNRIMNGNAVPKSIQINVNCYPRLDNRRSISTDHYGSLGNSVALEVYVVAHPGPKNIAWYHREKEVDMWQPFPHQATSFNGLYSNIIVHLATDLDFGYYKVNMSNDFGIYTNTYIINKEKMNDCGFPVGVVAGSISGSFLAGVCVGAVTIFLWLRWKICQRKGDTYESVDIGGVSHNKENVYASLNQDKTESSGDRAHENRGAAISQGPVESGHRPSNENMEMTSRIH